MNFAAIRTVENNGTVAVMERSRMPTASLPPRIERGESTCCPDDQPTDVAQRDSHLCFHVLPLRDLCLADLRPQIFPYCRRHLNASNQKDRTKCRRMHPVRAVDDDRDTPDHHRSSLSMRAAPDHRTSSNIRANSGFAKVSESQHGPCQQRTSSCNARVIATYSAFG